MGYDLSNAHKRCVELGLSSTFRDKGRLEVNLGHDIVLCFQNAESDEDCLIGFEDTPWHAHDEIMFSDAHGNFIVMNYLEILDGLADGRLLVCEVRKNGILSDRWLIHQDCNNEFKYMHPDEEIRVVRPTTNKVNHL